MNFTTLGGLTQCIASKNIASKIFWFILTTIGLFMTIYALINSFKAFAEFEVTTTTRIISNKTLVFPTVTICNANRVHCVNLLEKIQQCEAVSEEH